MATTNSIPRFREKTYRGKNGQTYTYYCWDGRGRGMKDVRLGSDRDRALELWAECERGNFKSVARPTMKRILKQRVTGSKRRVTGAEWAKQPEWARRMFYNAERRAKDCARPFTISPADFLEVIQRSAGACEISGIELDATDKGGPFFPSLDRIDNSHGYEPGNIRIVCHVANVAMNTWGIAPVLRLAAAIVAPTAGAGCA